MTTPATPSNSKPTGDDRNLVTVDETTAATFEDKLQVLWQKNRGLIIGLCIAVLLVIVGKGAWDYFARQKQLEIGRAYAAATTPEQLKSFAAAQADHPLAGVAHLRMADDAYAAGKYADAVTAYDKAIAILKDDPLTARARLGRALAKVHAGKAAEAQTELKQILDDAKQFKAVRTEAGYHLASMAVEARNAADAQKYTDQLMQLDPQSPWTSRAMMLRASLPPIVSAPTAPTTTEPAGTTPAPAKKEEAASGVEVKLPGKK